jgi:hypothetical protein
MVKGKIYLLLSVDENDKGTYKIGITKREISIRITELQTGNPNKISLLKEYQSEHYLKIEQGLHRKYGSKKTLVCNEWRNLSDEEINTFIDDCKFIESNIKFLLENNSLFK